MKSSRNIGEKKRVTHAPTEGDTEFPSKFRKADCLYINGVITSAAHGTYHVSLENGMMSICSANKLKNLKVGLMDGDRVTAEIPLLAMNPKEKLRGRIVWRHRQTYKK